MKRIVALLCFVAIMFTLVSCAKKNVEVSADLKKPETTDSEIVKLLLSPYGDTETVGLNAPARNYVSVTSNGYFTPGSLKFVSDDPDIAEIKYDSTALENCIYYKIEGVSVGKTTVHIESADGKVRTADITVTVKKYISTTTQLSIEYKPYHTKEEVNRYYYDDYDYTTKKTTTTTTEKKTEKDSSTTKKDEKHSKTTGKSGSFTVTLPTKPVKPAKPSSTTHATTKASTQAPTKTSTQAPTKTTAAKSSTSATHN